jgi:hypothetical protein
MARRRPRFPSPPRAPSRQRWCPARRGIDQRVRLLGEGLDHVPAVLFGGRDEGADGGEVVRALIAAEAAGDFLFDLGHAQVAFDVIVGERQGGIMEEAQDILLAQENPGRCPGLKLVAPTGSGLWPARWQAMALGKFARGVAHGTALSIWLTLPTSSLSDLSFSRKFVTDLRSNFLL